MLKMHGENYKVMRHLLNEGPLTAAGACQCFISNNLRSRVAELTKMGFTIVSSPVEGKKYNKYSIPDHQIAKQRELFSRHLHG